MNLASRRDAGERPPRGADGGRSRLCRRVVWRRPPRWDWGSGRGEADRDDGPAVVRLPPSRPRCDS